MVTRILQINSSIFGEQGQSSQLNAYLIDRLAVSMLSAKPGQTIDVTLRDLGKNPLPHLSLDTLVALGIKPEERSPAQVEAVVFADGLIKELMAADILVLAAPMYNFGVPSSLKAWMDYIARAGVTFRYTATGPEGLLKGKKAYVTSTRGGLHKGKPSDSQTDFVNTFLTFLGITDVNWIYAEGINLADYKESALVDAKKVIDGYLEEI
jgi:FMN-dependent NADH-azoreductase